MRLTLVDAKIPLKFPLHLRLEINYIRRTLLLPMDKTKFDDIHVVWEHYFQCQVILCHVCKVISPADTIANSMDLYLTPVIGSH